MKKLLCILSMVLLCGCSDNIIITNKTLNAITSECKTNDGVKQVLLVNDGAGIAFRYYEVTCNNDFSKLVLKENIK